jgi:hypothetical protein
VNESEGSLYTIQRDKMVMQKSWKGVVGRGDGGSQAVFCSYNMSGCDNVMIVIV